jgi:outer membrane protein
MVLSPLLGRLAAACVTVAAWEIQTAPAAAETLADAIATAYQTNPALEAQRAGQQIADESYIQARAGWRPTVALEASAGYSREPQSDPFFGTEIVTGNSGAAALTARQTLYSGGRTLEAVRAAKSDVLAGQQQLRSVEASVVAQVIASYVQVLLDGGTVKIRHQDVETLDGQLDETRARFKAGDLTRTDVAQIEAQLATAHEQLASAEAQLQASRGAYMTVVGQPPGELEDPPSLPGIAPTVDEAFDLAEANNPDLERARLVEAASAARVAEARDARRPVVALEASAGYIGPLVPFQTNNYVPEVAVQAVISQPLYSGGVIESGVRQALDQNTVDRIDIEAMRRNVDQAVAQAWNAWLTANANAKTAEDGLAAAQAAADGSRIEYRAGLRTTLDVLVAEQTLQNADLALAQSRHDQILAEAAVLAAEGRLEAGFLIKNLPIYDPDRSLRRRERASDLPLEGLAAAVDRIGSASAANPNAPPGPKPAVNPAVIAPAAAPPPADTPLATTWPTADSRR